jgi:O-antigen/teichoic acid export membrane protein
MLIFSKIFVELVYGVSYLPALVPLWILLIGVVLKAPMSILAYYFKSIGLPEVMVKISIITVVLNVISGLLFIPRYGIIAAAIISTISYTIYSILLSRKYMKMTNKGLSEQYLFSQSEITLIKDYIISFNINSK